jgi:hypothetical protein
MISPAAEGKNLAFLKGTCAIFSTHFAASAKNNAITRALSIRIRVREISGGVCGG